MKMLVCTDGSKHSLKAEQKAVEIARHLEFEEVIILHVYQISLGQSSLNLFDEGVTSNEITKQMDELDDLDVNGKLNEQLEEKKLILENATKLFREKNIHVRTLLKEGRPSKTICEVAAEENVDMVIVGSRGKSSMGISLGSVSNAVSQNCYTTTVIVK